MSKGKEEMKFYLKYILLGFVIGLLILSLLSLVCKTQPIPWEPAWRDSEHDENVIYLTGDESNSLTITNSRFEVKE